MVAILKLTKATAEGNLTTCNRAAGGNPAGRFSFTGLK
jgi:hypothetical protein